MHMHIFYYKLLSFARGAILNCIFQESGSQRVYGKPYQRYLLTKKLWKRPRAHLRNLYHFYVFTFPETRSVVRLCADAAPLFDFL
jgi:hypothetical protein